MYLAIDQESGKVLESSGGFFYVVEPRPIISFAASIDDPFAGNGWAGLVPHAQFCADAKLALREEHFDAVTRTRRGRLYELSEGVQPSIERISNAGVKERLVWKYQPPWNLLDARKRAPLRHLALGAVDFATLWQVSAMEFIAGGDMLVTLRAVDLLGVVPDLNEKAIPPAGYGRLKDAVQRLADNAYRQPPEGLVDSCRAVLTIALAEYIHAREPSENALTKDLGQLTNALRRLKPVKDAAASAADVVARLHTRGKPNVQQEHGARAPTLADAEFALHAAGLVLRDFGWCRTN